MNIHWSLMDIKSHHGFRTFLSILADHKKVLFWWSRPVFRFLTLPHPNPAFGDDSRLINFNCFHCYDDYHNVLRFVAWSKCWFRFLFSYIYIQWSTRDGKTTGFHFFSCLGEIILLSFEVKENIVLIVSTGYLQMVQII